MFSSSEGFPDTHAAPSTLVDLLRWRALHHSDRLAYTFLMDGEKEEMHLTYGELDQRARAIGFLLQMQGANGERALLLYPPGLEYIAALFGCLYAGVVAVPAYLPQPNRPLSRLQSIVADSQTTLALTTTSILTPSNLQQWFAHAPNLEALRWFTTDGIEDGSEWEWRKPEVASDTLAFLQYTSGSTSTPKGVMLSHGNLMHNLALINHGFQLNHTSKGVFWLPMYHDMGLIGGILEPMYVEGSVVIMSPISFLQRPIRWLQAISRYKATVSGAPNFAYKICSDKITPDQLGTLDLSGWSLAFCGAEPVRYETLERFAATFESCGFRREAFYPCYGLAEATLLVAGSLGPAWPTICNVERAALERGRVVEVSAGEERAQTFVSCGRSLLDQKIVIVDPESLTRCSPDQVGEVWVSGPSVAQSYWGRPEETEQTFHARLANAAQEPFLRTGDLGFMRDGELFITGRLKDLLVVRGRNHYPQDIELTVGKCHPSLRSGCAAAFSVEIAGAERVVIVHEIERHHRNVDREEVVGAIRQTVAEHHGIQVYTVVLVKPGGIPKTSSGKVQRYACREGFLKESLNVWENLNTEVALQNYGGKQCQTR